MIVANLKTIQEFQRNGADATEFFSRLMKVGSAARTGIEIRL
jgi:hypothetical protein